MIPTPSTTFQGGFSGDAAAEPPQPVTVLGEHRGEEKAPSASTRRPSHSGLAAPAADAKGIGVGRRRAAGGTGEGADRTVGGGGPGRGGRQPALLLRAACARGRIS